MESVSALGYTLVPIAAAVLGAAFAAVRRPGPIVASAIQHFAAGVVFAAAAGKVLPSLKHSTTLWPIVIGGSSGIIVMMVLQQLGERTKGPAALIALVSVDVVIDGLVLGLGFVTSARAIAKSW